MAEPESDYSWVFGLVILFFMFVLPILKKVADALAGKKGQEIRGTGPVREEPQKRGVFGEMIDEVEDYFRKARAQQEEKAGPASGTGGRSRRERTTFDLQYGERRREVEERRRQREERRERKRLETAWQPEPPSGEMARSVQPLADTGLREPVLKPVIESSMEPFDTIGEELGREKLTALAEEEKVEEKEEDFFGIFGELPEMARVVVFSEVLSQPKSMRPAGETI